MNKKPYKFIIASRHSGKTHFQRIMFLNKAPKCAKKTFEMFIKGKMGKEEFLNIIATLCEAVIDLKGE